MATNPSFGLSFTLIDRSAEIGRTGINTAASTPPDGATVDTFRVDFLGLLSTGTVTSVSSTTTSKTANAAVGAGNREDRWLVRYEDTVTLKTYNFQVPTRDNSLVTVEGTDRLDLDDTVNPGIADAITAAEALVASPDGNAIQILDILVLGGR